MFSRHYPTSEQLQIIIVFSWAGSLLEWCYLSWCHTSSTVQGNLLVISVPPLCAICSYFSIFGKLKPKQNCQDMIFLERKNMVYVSHLCQKFLKANAPVCELRCRHKHCLRQGEDHPWARSVWELQWWKDGGVLCSAEHLGVYNRPV